MGQDQAAKAVRPVRGWRCYYADGSTADSEKTTWLEAPVLGLQAVVVFSEDEYTIYRPELGKFVLEPYRQVFVGADYYWRVPAKDPGWDAYGAGQAPDVPPGADVKVGTLLASDDFDKISNTVQLDFGAPAATPAPA